MRMRHGRRPRNLSILNDLNRGMCVASMALKSSETADPVRNAITSVRVGEGATEIGEATASMRTTSHRAHEDDLAFRGLPTVTILAKTLPEAAARSVQYFRPRLPIDLTTLWTCHPASTKMSVRSQIGKMVLSVEN